MYPLSYKFLPFKIFSFFSYFLFLHHTHCDPRSLLGVIQFQTQLLWIRFRTFVSLWYFSFNFYLHFLPYLFHNLPSHLLSFITCSFLSFLTYAFLSHSCSSAPAFVSVGALHSFFSFHIPKTFFRSFCLIYEPQIRFSGTRRKHIFKASEFIHPSLNTAVHLLIHIMRLGHDISGYIYFSVLVNISIWNGLFRQRY